MITIDGNEYKLKRHLTSEEIAGIWVREVKRRQHRKDNDIDSIQQYSDELKIEHQDIISKCTYEDFNLLDENVAFKLWAQIVYDSETARGIIYR